MYAPVASDSSLISLPALTLRHNLHLKQIDVKTAFVSSPLEHDAKVRFITGYEHPSGYSHASLHNLLRGLKHEASDRYDLQHVWLMTFNPDVRRFVDDCQIIH